MRPSDPKTLYVIYHDNHVVRGPKKRPSRQERSSTTFEFASPCNNNTLVQDAGHLLHELSTTGCNRFIYNSPDSLNKLIADMLDAGIIPYITTQQGCDITSISFRKVLLHHGTAPTAFLVTVPCKVHGESGTIFKDDDECRLY